ncbi:MAG: SIS domain-containing protein [Schaalia hyovaginalis]|uniref:SIS domain-containing protein n=1 Tax=Schaalia hyovaginalis TaxID=29316 RepID=UPI0023F8E782|nr:SIS domain-containing protein [Schaalia hyovaginalis]MCI7672255.1 SIS domain-containing protein [Schaalia hyovaginalis]MDY5506688.1 SIS domain-containing protein [Schaalia hyovaginalis]MDY6214083.1 SIS domain-containing protein [Schaalia hyovaginalis]
MTEERDGAALLAAEEALRIEAEALAVLRARADVEQIVRVARVLLEAPRIVTVGSGSSGLAAAKFAHSLCCADNPAKFMPPSEAVHGGLGAVHAGDAVVMVTRGGGTEELVPIMHVVNARGATLIGLTENLDSELAACSDILLPLHITRESDPLGTMATTSNTVVGVLFDAVLAAMIAISGFTSAEFGLIHPGGAVGTRLAKEVGR